MSVVRCPAGSSGFVSCGRELGLSIHLSIKHYEYEYSRTQAERRDLMTKMYAA